MMGCEKAQGYGIARPMPVNDFNNWLALYQPNDDWIAWANETHHQKESKLKVFDIALQYEFNALSKRISSPTIQEGEQVKQHQSRVCTGWLNRNKQKKVFSKDWLTELENAYQLMHQSAEALYQHQLNSKTDNTISNLKKIKSSFDDVMMIMSKVP